MSAFEDVWRITSAQSVALTSTATASGAALNRETYAVDLSFIAAVGAGAFINIGSTVAVADSTNGMMLPANWVQRYKVTPGQTVSGRCIGSTSGTLFITQLTK